MDEFYEMNKISENHQNDWNRQINKITKKSQKLTNSNQSQNP